MEAAIRQAKIQDRRVGIELLAESVSNHFKPGKQCAVIKTDAGQKFNVSGLFYPNGAIGIDHNLRDGLARK